MSDIDRFLKYVKTNPTTQCWEWTGALDRTGYGAFKYLGKKINSHRFSYRHYKGEIPKGLDVDHRCRIRKCVNPEHLEAVTRKINVARGLSSQERKTHCIHGHAYTPENTYRYPSGARECRTCKYYGGRIPE